MKINLAFLKRKIFGEIAYFKTNRFIVTDLRFAPWCL